MGPRPLRGGGPCRLLSRRSKRARDPVAVEHAARFLVIGTVELAPQGVVLEYAIDRRQCGPGHARSTTEPGERDVDGGLGEAHGDRGVALDQRSWRRGKVVAGEDTLPRRAPGDRVGAWRTADRMREDLQMVALYRIVEEDLRPLDDEIAVIEPAAQGEVVGPFAGERMLPLVRLSHRNAAAGSSATERVRDADLLRGDQAVPVGWLSLVDLLDSNLGVGAGNDLPDRFLAAASIRSLEHGLCHGACYPPFLSAMWNPT